ncbi:MAG: MarR family winged helix-turn-helix transcriptional regulator [Gemmataceae bacterium]
MPAAAKQNRPTRRLPASRSEQPLDHLILFFGRAYYSYVGLLERVLTEEGIDQWVQPGMGHVLFALFEQDNRSIKEIGARTQLACSTLTGLLERMTRNGLIERQRDEQDGRVTRIRLTDLGRSLEPRCRAVVGRIDSLLRTALNNTEMERATSLLQRLVETMRDAAANPT